tara:strand:+ start:757 stop:1209 length:453 start_codon:yes stop_codon:yes gene_type:complete
MTRYDWICNECEVIWEEDHPLGKAPKKTNCPECGELRERNWASVSTFRMKGECHTNRVRLRKSYNEGMDKDTAEEFYDQAIKNSNTAIKTGWQHYSKVVPNIEAMRKVGGVRRRSDHEYKDAVERAKKMTQAVYNDTNTDIGESLKRKPQ